MRQILGSRLSGQRVGVFAILIDFANLPTVDIVTICTQQQFMTKPHQDSLTGSWDLVCGQEGPGNRTEDLEPFRTEVTVVWSKKLGPRVCSWENGTECSHWRVLWASWPVWPHGPTRTPTHLRTAGCRLPRRCLSSKVQFGGICAEAFQRLSLLSSEPQAKVLLGHRPIIFS